MRMRLLERRQAVFGLDIGKHEAKFAQLARSGRGHRLVGLGSLPLPEGTMIEGVVAEPEALANALMAGLHDPAIGRVSARAVAASLPQAHLFTRIVTLPAMERSKLGEAVQWEAQQYIPVAMTDLYTDFEIVSTIKAPDGSPKEHEILLVAAPRAIVDSYMQLFERMRIVPHSLEMSLAANMRALVPDQKSRQTVLVMDVGSIATDMSIMTDVLRVTTTVQAGGDQLTAALVKKLKVKPTEAEEIKVKFGITQSDLQAKILAALDGPLKSLAKEITKLIKYHAERAKDPKQQKVERVLMTGGASRMPGLAHYISHATQLPVDISSPWDHYTIKPKDALPAGMAPVYTTAFGLALRGYDA